MSEQRSNEWFNARLGRFTSSCISQLMGIKGLGLTGETYAFSKAVELFVGKDNEEGFTSFDMQRGIELEPFAFDKLKSILAEDFISIEKCGFIELGENTGGSPDGLFGIDGVFDIKCPKPDKFFKIVCTDLIDQSYKDQLQHQMYVTGRRKAISFQYCVFNGVEYWHRIDIERDDENINLMKIRIKQATQIRDNFLEQLNNKNQWKQQN